jgi:cytoskeleton protein RodZ
METEETEFDSAMPERSEIKKEVHSFGERLFLAREQQNLTIEEVATMTHLSGDVIEAIERSDVNRLPQPIYVQGYIRAYAKCVGISADAVLEEYNRVAPHPAESKLAPPQELPKGLNSSAPVVKIVSSMLLVLIVFAGVYGVFSYYNEITETMDDDLAADGLEQVNAQGQDHAQNQDQDVLDDVIASMNEYEPELVEELAVGSQEDGVLSGAVVKNSKQAESDNMQERVMGGDTERAALINTQPIADGSDELKLVAHKASWVEVVDGNDVTLHYNLALEGKSLVLRGTAPFDIFLGNAPAVDVMINNIKVDLRKYVRTNNIAHFKVSMENERVVFH